MKPLYAKARLFNDTETSKRSLLFFFVLLVFVYSFLRYSYFRFSGMISFVFREMRGK